VAIEDIPVDSSMLSRARYDDEAQNLTVTMAKGGKEYSTDGVTKEMWQDFLAAPSKGQWWLANVKGRG
jgi:hypothetical protein